MKTSVRIQPYLILTLLATLILLPACTGQPQLPPPVAEPDFVPVISVTGRVAPALWATVSAQSAGRVVAVAAALGDEIAQDAVLLRLEDADARLAVAQAEAALAAAEAQLAQAQAPPRAEELAAAEAGVAQAEAALDRVLQGATEPQLRAARAELRNVEAALRQAQAAYDPISWLPDRSMHPESLQLEQATNAYTAAKARYDELVRGASAAEVRQAQAVVAEAQARLALLRAGARPETLRVIEVEVAAARVQLEQARLALARCEVTAPFAGTVGAVHVRVGEVIAPGQPLFTLGDLNTLRVETTDLDEIDVVQVEEGAAVTLTFDAFPHQTYTARISRIAPMADPSSAGVNYTLHIALDQIPPGIRWGMTAFVDIEP